MTVKRILIISADTELLKILEGNLPGSTYEVVNTEVRQAELKEMMEQARPDLIVLDIAMPKLEGIELCLRIRRLCDVPIIMLSTWGAGRNAVRGLDLSSDSYLTEPFAATELKSRIEKTLCCN